MKKSLPIPFLTLYPEDLKNGIIFDSISSYLGEMQHEETTGEHKRRAENTNAKREREREEKHLCFDQLTVGSSILFTTTSSLDTPRVFAS
jgi:hypothetical protein